MSRTATTITAAARTTNPATAGTVQSVSHGYGPGGTSVGTRVVR